MIPKTIHFGYFWEEPPAWAEANVAEFRAMNPDCTVQFWRAVPADFPYLEQLEWAPTYRFKSDLVRYWMLQTLGGLWVDVDCRPCKPFDGAIWNRDCFVVSFNSKSNTADNWFMGSEAGHPVWETIIGRCLDRDHWPFPDHYFGTTNAMMKPAPNNDAYPTIDIPGLVKLPPEMAAQIVDASRWRDLYGERQPPVAAPEAYMVHYRVHGQKSVRQDVRGWCFSRRQILGFDREFVVEFVRQFPEAQDLLEAHDAYHRPVR